MDIDFKSIKPGDKVRWKENCIGAIHEATFIHFSAYYDLVVIRKVGETFPSFGWPIQSSAQRTTYQVPDDAIWAHFVMKREVVEIIHQSTDTKAVKGNGMHCSSCNALNEYAEPNQKDGTYRCYECRR